MGMLSVEVGKLCFSESLDVLGGVAVAVNPDEAGRVVWCDRAPAHDLGGVLDRLDHAFREIFFSITTPYMLFPLMTKKFHPCFI